MALEVAKPAPVSVPVKNTFVHFPGETDFSPIPFRRSKSEYLPNRQLLQSNPKRAALWEEFNAKLELTDENSEEEEEHFKDEMKVGRTNSNQSTAVDSCADWLSESDDEGKEDPLDKWSEVDEAEEVQEVEDVEEAKGTQELVEAEAMRGDPPDPLCSGNPAIGSSQASTPLQAKQQELPPTQTQLDQVHSEKDKDKVLQQQPWANRAPTTATETGILAIFSAGTGKPASVVWTVQSAEVNSTRNKICSGQFFIPLPGYGPCPFQIILYAEDRMSKGANGDPQGFQRSQGRGRVEIRCQANLPSSLGRLVVDMSVGTGRSAVPRRGPLTHDFSQQACCGWRRVDFRSAVDPTAHALPVCANFAIPQ